MPKTDFSTLIGKQRIFRKDFGPPFQAKVEFISDNDQYVRLLLDNGVSVWESVDHLIIEEDLENTKENHM